MKLSNGDPLRSGVVGEAQPTCTILIKIRRRKLTSDSASSLPSVNKVTVEPLGIVNETFKFVRPADIQFLPSSIHKHVDADDASSIIEVIPRPFIKPEMEYVYFNHLFIPRAMKKESKKNETLPALVVKLGDPIPMHPATGHSVTERRRSLASKLKAKSVLCVKLICLFPFL